MRRINELGNTPYSRRRIVDLDEGSFEGERLRGVVIENRDALACMRQHDGPDTLHYADPPYVLSTRSDHRGDYPFEMSDVDHQALAAGLIDLKGKVIVSGYRCDLYDDLYAGWKRIDKNTHADGAAKRIESLWLSPNHSI